MDAQIKTEGISPLLRLSHAVFSAHPPSLTQLYARHSDKRPLITQQMDAPLITGQSFYKLAYYVVSAWGGSVAAARGSVAAEHWNTPCVRLHESVSAHAPGLRSAPMLCSLTKGQVSH